MPPLFDGLKLAARGVGSKQIQNVGTIFDGKVLVLFWTNRGRELVTMKSAGEFQSPDGTFRLTAAARS